MTSKQLVKQLRIFAESESIDSNPSDPEWQANHYKVTLKMRYGNNWRQFTTVYSKGFGLSGEPTASEVIDCLALDIQGIEGRTFEYWAGDLGYDTDSRKAERIYKAIQSQSTKLVKFFGDSYDKFIDLESM